MIPRLRGFYLAIGSVFSDGGGTCLAILLCTFELTCNLQTIHIVRTLVENFWAFYNPLLRSNNFLFLLIKYFGMFCVTIRTVKCPFWFTYITPSKKLCFGDDCTSFYSGITPS